MPTYIVAESLDEARSQWVDVFNRDRADLRPRHAAERAAEDIRWAERTVSPCAP
jgi:exodeoxyribonuclease V alpha subunit